MSNIPAAVSFGAAGITGQLQMNAKSDQVITIPANSVDLAIPLPVGLSPAAFAAISALVMQDLSFKLAVIVGATPIPVPPNTTVIVYNAAAIYVTSVTGGTFKLVLG